MVLSEQRSAKGRARRAPARRADEIDAIGKKRGRGGGDAGTREREGGLLQLLYEMDGFKQNDRVLARARPAPAAAAAVPGLVGRRGGVPRGHARKLQ